ncbi:hypothetical protein HDU86_006788 [Geranomyces michiganensis]|nr:hypothetical protein HDU86_006788 [Geranomyces michiganensis]
MARRRNPHGAAAAAATATAASASAAGSRNSNVSRPSVFDLPLSSASNSESKGTIDDAFDTEGNFKETLPSAMSVCIDADGNPTLVETPSSSASGPVFANDVAAGAEGHDGFPFHQPEPLYSNHGNATTTPAATAAAGAFRHIIPNADIIRSPEPIAENAANGDLDPGTSTEEDFMEEELERDALAEERAEKKKQAALSSMAAASKEAAAATAKAAKSATAGDVYASVSAE